MVTIEHLLQQAEHGSVYVHVDNKNEYSFLESFLVENNVMHTEGRYDKKHDIIHIRKSVTGVMYYSVVSKDAVPSGHSYVEYNNIDFQHNKLSGLDVVKWFCNNIDDKKVMVEAFGANYNMFGLKEVFTPEQIYTNIVEYESVKNLNKTTRRIL